MLGLICLMAGGIISIVTGDYLPMAISTGACALLFIIGIETDLYGPDEQKIKEAMERAQNIMHGYEIKKKEEP